MFETVGTYFVGGEFPYISDQKNKGRVSSVDAGKENKLKTAAITAVIALVLGIGIGYFMRGTGEPEPQAAGADQDKSRPDPSIQQPPDKREGSFR